MARAWTEELIWAEAADGVQHDGVIWRPATPTPERPAVLCVHGAGGSFTHPQWAALGRSLAARGHVVVCGNNRGHDMGAALRHRSGADTLGGVWWERVSESALDVAAWIDKAVELGHPRVVLLGKSYGPIKAVWYTTEHPDDTRVVGLVLGSGFIDIPRRRRAYAEAIAEAERMEADGRGRDLLPWGMLGGGFVTTSAATLLDRWRSLPDLYGSEAPDAAPIGRVTCPILAFYGTNEPEMGAASDLETLRRNARAARVDTAMIEGMDHSWSGYEETLVGLVHDWLTTLA